MISPPVFDITVGYKCRFVYIHIFHIATVLQTLMASDNSVPDVATLVIILPPVVNDFPGVNDIAEPMLIHTFIANRPLKLSINAFCVGLPGWIKRNSTPCLKAH